MRKTTDFNVRAFGVVAIAVAGITVLSGCNEGSASQAQAQAVQNDSDTAEAARVAELNAREQALARREADLAAKEKAQADAQAAAPPSTVRSKNTAKSASTKKAVVAKASSPKSVQAAAVNGSQAHSEPVRMAMAPLEVPAGTPLTVALISALSTKTAKPGDIFEARLVSDLMVRDRRAALAGTRVMGTVTDVISGSHAIGAVPTLGLKFDHLDVDGREIPIEGTLIQQGNSEKARDTAKILGGAAAGAILGHQVKKNDTGTIVGGLLGGAAGAVAAKKTGTEVQLDAGTTVTVTLSEAFKIAAM